MHLGGGIVAWLLLVQVSVGVTAADGECVHHDHTTPPPAQHHEHEPQSNDDESCTMHVACGLALELDIGDVEEPTIALQTDRPAHTLPTPRSAIRAPEPPPPKA